MPLVRSTAKSLGVTLVAVTVLSALAVTLGWRVFGLTLVGAIALYLVLWWIVLFAVLPFGARSQSEAGEVLVGSDPGAPHVPALNEKAIWTTLVAAVVFVVSAWLLPLAGL